MSVCAAPTCSHQSFDGSSYYIDVDVIIYNVERRLTIQCIFHVKPHFLKTLFQSRLLLILMIFLPTKTELNVILNCNFSINL